MFTIGDRVRRTCSDTLGLRVGDVREVSAVHGGHIQLVRAHPDDAWPRGFGFNAAMFEPYVPAAATPRSAPTPNTSRKDDSGKLDMTLLEDMPLAIQAVVEVMQWAVTKKLPVPYARGSWQGVHADRYRAAMKRHDLYACIAANGTPVPAREQRDEETNMLHLAHIACSALMALENTIREMEGK